ncbi:hypothetical protein R6Q59_010001 [Mikania micrantha]
MAENVPPGSAGKSTAAADRPGLPYYEKLRRDLRDTIQKKRVLDRNMIYRQETAYLEETSIAGNIVKGFDNYIKASAVTQSTSAAGGTISGSAAGGGLGARRKAAVNDTDRVFSKSSVSFNRDSETPSSAVSTPINVGTPAGSIAGGDERPNKKKKKNAVNDDDGDTRTTKRQKISFNSGRKGHDD